MCCPNSLRRRNSMKRGPIAIETMSATSAATRTLLTERLGHDLEPHGTRAFHEHRVVRADELARERDSLGGRRRPRVRGVVPGQLADADHDGDGSCCAADLLVVTRRVWPELGHVAEDRHGAPAVRALLQVRERG